MVDMVPSAILALGLNQIWLTERFSFEQIFQIMTFNTVHCVVNPEDGDDMEDED